MKIIITEAQLKQIVECEQNGGMINEAQTKIDNFDLIAQKIMEDGDDNVYPVQIIRRWKDNPTDFAGKAEGKRNGTYADGAWYLKHWLVRSVDELQQLKPEIIKWCEDNNARAYIMLNARSYNDTTNYINAQKRKYGRSYRPTEEIKAWFASKTGPNWRDQRPKLFLDIDSPNQDLWDAVHNMIAKYGINVVTEYKTPSGGLHIVLADKNQQGLAEFRRNLVIFDGGRDLKRHAMVHPNEDGKLILYSNVQTPGYINEEYDPMDDYDYLISTSKIRLLVKLDTMQLVDIDRGDKAPNVDEGYAAIFIETDDFSGGHYEYGGNDYDTEPYCDYSAGEWGGEYSVDFVDCDEDLDDSMIDDIVEKYYNEIKEAFEECAEPER